METFTFKENDTFVKISYDNNWAEACFKDPDFNGAIKVTVKENHKKDDEKISRYLKIWEGDDVLTNATYLIFVKRFISDVDFRKEFLQDGELWEETVSFSDNSGVNVKCKNAIRKLNSKKKPKFKDFAELKTYGRDNFSSMRKDELLDHIAEVNKDMIEGAFEDEDLQLKAFRWCARGLAPGKSIRKVKTDIEIQENVSRR